MKVREEWKSMISGVKTNQDGCDSADAMRPKTSKTGGTKMQKEATAQQGQDGCDPIGTSGEREGRKKELTT